MVPLIKKCFPSGQCWCRRKLPYVLFSLPSLYPSCRACCAPWSLPRSQQDQAPIVHRSNLKIFWPHVRTWIVSCPVRREQRRGFSFGEHLDWTNPSSLKQYLNYTLSPITVTKVAQPSLPPCSAPQQMLCWLVFPEGHCGGDVFAIHENSILLRTPSYLDFLRYYPGCTVVRSCCMGWRPCLALQIAEQNLCSWEIDGPLLLNCFLVVANWDWLTHMLWGWRLWLDFG